MTGRLLLAVVVCFLVSYCHAVPMRHGDDGLFTELREKRGGGGQCPNPGCKGQKGAKGPPGQQGQRGYTGHRGQQGQCDASYCLWFLKNNMPTPPPPPQDPPMGLPGMKGEPGEPGPKGDPGVPGSKGLPGMPGRPGNDGEKGDSGIPGEPGNPGRKGLPGPEGPPGMNGDPGLTGERGRKGIAGDPGEPGADGPPGRTGVPGKEGLPGIPGAPGEPGRNGTDGMKGERGLPGPPIEVIPRLDSEPCTEELQGVIRFDPDEKRLYFCDGMKWVCIQSMDCGGAPTCSSPFGAQNIGDQWYQVFARNVTAETQDAADIVLVIDDSGSMNREHAWLLIMVPLLEQTLISAGVGDGADVRNRYCAVAFGGFPNDREAGHFLPVNGEPCFFASDFPIAQAQLQNAGLREDGWEAIQFALDNIPFRESPFIAKNIILITDEGRTPIPQGENITREGLEAELKSNDILLNVVVWADYEVTNKPEEVVIGVDAKGNSYLLRPNGTFATTTDPVVVTQAEGDTADVYVDLALDVTGAAWALRVLRESSIDQNIEIQQSFTSAIAEVKLREIRATIESCRRCTCVAGLEEGTTVSDCTIAEDEPFCRCVVENEGNAGECVRTSVEEVPEGEGPEEPGPVGLIRSENFLQLDDAPSEK